MFKIRWLAVNFQKQCVNVAPCSVGNFSVSLVRREVYNLHFQASSAEHAKEAKLNLLSCSSVQELRLLLKTTAAHPKYSCSL